VQASRLLVAALAFATQLAPVAADARALSASFEASFTVVATCSVNVAQSAHVQVACASPTTPYRLNSTANRASTSNNVASLQLTGPDEQRVTVYF